MHDSLSLFSAYCTFRLLTSSMQDSLSIFSANCIFLFSASEVSSDCWQCMIGFLHFPPLRRLCSCIINNPNLWDINSKMQKGTQSPHSALKDYFLCILVMWKCIIVTMSRESDWLPSLNLFLHTPKLKTTVLMYLGTSVVTMHNSRHVQTIWLTSLYKFISLHFDYCL